ncbi:hypothetical protein [Amycolatopsis rubida]|uniref:Uncharacterized protein n=1 Tax=Amycolatopsis rubida TaxID=112413 RepID=A0A1I5TJZ0_9PSEU|nr:hypothetical protein [Amycolatopsis rubida]SFP83394.1 hypothetical protein SAMN05421854_107136 [Amycolatopsis rubida]
MSSSEEGQERPRNAWTKTGRFVFESFAWLGIGMGGIVLPPEDCLLRTDRERKTDDRHLPDPRP